MEPFKFTNTTTPTDLVGAAPISGWDSFMWVERYRDAGEFEISAKVSSGLKEFLPTGTFISHVDTREVCVVENHEIEETADEDPTIKITGRSMEVLMDDRIVGMSVALDGGQWVNFVEYSLTAAYPAAHAKTLANQYIKTGTAIVSADAYPNIACEAQTITVGTSEARVVKRGSVYSAFINLLSMGKAGVCVIRKGSFGHRFAESATDTYFYIHAGEDKTDTVFFSTDTGDIDSAQYLWSLKTLKNVALVTGQYTEVVVEDAGAPDNYGRRIMLVDAGDIDREYDPGLSQAIKDAMRDAMKARGREALAAQRAMALSSIDISRNYQYKYRVDYDIGDLVSVYANYGQIETRRVIEHVEIEDETGAVGYPTLAELEV